MCETAIVTTKSVVVEDETRFERFNHCLTLSYYFFVVVAITKHSEMGVAGDGSKGLDKEWKGQAQMAKSKTMSAKVAWGKSTGYADVLISQGVEASRAQQIENWKNQREVQEQRNQHRWMTDEFDKSKADEDWRSLSSFQGQQVQKVDMDSVLGAVIPGPVLGTIELASRINQASVFEFEIKVSVVQAASLSFICLNLNCTILCHFATNAEYVYGIF